MSATCSRPAGAIRVLAVIGPLLLGGCAGTPPAPVESRGPATVPPGPRIAAPPETAVAVDAAGPSAATVIPLGPEESGPAPAPPAAMPPATEPLRPVNPAVVALLNRANGQRDAGQHAAAAASLERAIKIEPGDPWLWHRLAVSRLDQGRPGEAASLAAKSNSLAAGDAELQAANWRLIARVHRERGEDVAAKAAEERARKLSVPRS